MSDKGTKFIGELEDLCIWHGVTIAVTSYDGIEFWDMDEGDPFIHCSSIEDNTHD